MVRPHSTLFGSFKRDTQAFERFWEHIKDEWMGLNHDQCRCKRNVYLKSIRHFESCNGRIPLYEITREQALAFRAWHLDRIEKQGLKPCTGNREINSLRRLVTINLDIDASSHPNPFQRLRLKDTKERHRKPLSTELIQHELLKPGALDGLQPELNILVRLLVNTGMRPSEALGLELGDIRLSSDVPHVWVHANKARSLKNQHSERSIPLFGVSLQAARELVACNGWGKWLGKNMYATSAVNKYFRESLLVTDKRQSLYSLRHWFQDQLTRLDVIDRAQAQLMGHKFHRPKYGRGKSLEELAAIIEKFAL